MAQGSWSRITTLLFTLVAVAVVSCSDTPEPRYFRGHG